jgi:flagellar motility protein MotE (MotC chaperone)
MTMHRSGAAGTGRPRLRLRLAGLTLISVLFVSSGGLRLAELDMASLGGVPSWFPSAEAQPSDDGPLETAPESRSPDDVIEVLKAREAALEERERVLEERAYALELAAAEVATQLEALAAAEESLRETLALADGAAREDLERLTRMYETMKPKEAAALFETMDPTFAAGFLGQMAPAAAAEIMSGLSPESAYTISLVLAGRNMRVPTD